MKKRVLFGAVLILLILLFATLLSDHLPQWEKQPPSQKVVSPIPQVTAPSPSPLPKSLPVSPPKRAASISEKYRFSEIDSLVKRSRNQLALCLLRNKDFQGTRLHMTLNWDGSGALKKIVLSPNPGEAVEGCIRDLANSWNLPSHPGLQPFSYKAVLAPSGL